AILARAKALWQAEHPDTGDDRFDERYFQVASTFDGAGVARGDLTPECAAAVQAVLEALGKKAGPEDARTEGQRFHDALQLGCEMLIRAKMVPDRAGADTQVLVHVALSQLREMPGASVIEDSWLAGQPGYLTGKDAETAACDALTIPVVTGHADMTIIDQMISLALAAHGAGYAGQPEGAADSSDAGARPGPGDGDAREHHSYGGRGDGGGDSRAPASTGGDHADRDGTAGNHADAPDSPGGGHSDRPADTDAPDGPGGRPGPISPEASQALRYAIARLAIDFVSGPDNIASALRTGLLKAPFNTPSLPLDIGHSDSIPAAIRRAVTLRDKHCSWPGGCDTPAAGCDVHHHTHQHDGGPTSLTNCGLFCQTHHDIFIHRLGWQVIRHPDGTSQARSPDGKLILHSHAPPTRRAG
ncbi:MAG TPA: DUF222 domain-containing protein, partial [Trebonia sp.]